MNREEVSRCYGLSMELLEQYENWNLRKNGEKGFSYSAQDLQRLSLVVLLRDIGFSWEECRVFLCLETGKPAAGYRCWNSTETYCWKKSTGKRGCLSSWMACAFS